MLSSYEMLSIRKRVDWLNILIRLIPGDVSALKKSQLIQQETLELGC